MNKEGRCWASCNTLAITGEFYRHLPVKWHGIIDEEAAPDVCKINGLITIIMANWQRILMIDRLQTAEYRWRVGVP